MNGKQARKLRQIARYQKESKHVWYCWFRTLPWNKKNELVSVYHSAALREKLFFGADLSK